MSKSKHGFKKNQRLEISIESIAAGGQGFCKCNGTSIFVDEGVPGDKAVIELYDLRKDFALARIDKLIETSPLRQKAPCALFKVCGGCQWQHIKYENQLSLKADMLKQVVKHIGGLDPKLILPARPAAHPFNYRNKVQFPVSSPKNSARILAGYYKKGSHELINIKHCPIQPQILDTVMEMAKQAAEQAGISAYNEETHTGLLRHMIARYSFARQEILFTLVLNTQPQALEAILPSLREFADQLMDKFSEIVGVCVNHNNKRGNRIMGEPTRLIAGRDYIVEILQSNSKNAGQTLRDGLQFRISAQSFFQINSEQAVLLMDLVYDAISEYCQAKNMQRIPLILDAFAGVGSLALWVSELAEKVIAIEEVEEAINDANRIIDLNAIQNVELICDKVELALPKLVEQDRRANVVILDPPRKGVDQEALLALAKMKPELIVYVSCNPATLARDLKILENQGFKTRSIQPVDLFPQTYHVESVSILERS